MIALVAIIGCGGVVPGAGSHDCTEADSINRGTYDVSWFDVDNFESLSVLDPSGTGHTLVAAGFAGGACRDSASNQDNTCKRGSSGTLQLVE